MIGTAEARLLLDAEEELGRMGGEEDEMEDDADADVDVSFGSVVVEWAEDMESEGW